MKFGEKLQKLRKQKGMSQEELAYNLNVSRQAVSKWENNQGFPETEKIIQAAKLFNVSLDYLLNEQYANDVQNNDQEQGYYASKEVVEGYIAWEKRNVEKKGLGILVFIISFIFPLLLDSNIGNILFLIGITSAIGIFVIYEFEEEKYKEITQQPLFFDYSFIEQFKLHYIQMKKKYVRLVVVGIVILAIGIIIPVTIREGFGINNNAYDSIFVVALAIAVYIFMMVWNMLEAYEVIINNEEYILEKGDPKREWYYEITLGIAAFIFLGIGFIWDAWHPAWIIFPVTSLLTEGYIRLKGEKR